MTTRLAWLLILSLGCDAEPSGGGDATLTTDATADIAPDTTGGEASVTFAVSLPPETPADAMITIRIGDRTVPLGATTVPQGALTWTVMMDDQVELDPLGAPVVHTNVITGDVRLTTEVARWGPPGGRTRPDVVFLVRVPAGTDSTTGLWISGNVDGLGVWDAAGLRLYRAQDDTWAAVFTTDPGVALEYKVTRGAWATVEKGAGGEEVPNRAYTVTSSLARLEIDVAAWADDFVAPPTGDARIELLTGVGSQYLEPDRDVIVWLPPGYDTDTTRRYPVLYMHDGQNLMDQATSAFGEWYVDEAAEYLVQAGDVEPLIIVGVYNTNDRIAEYTPTADPQYGGGDADDYGRFLTDELKPRIDQTFRTRTEAAVTGIAGSSLGGLVSLYLGLERSDVFGRAGVISPSVWWDDRAILDEVEVKVPLRVWLDIGTEEGGGESVGDTEALRDRLVQKGWVLGTDLAYTAYPGGEHNEASWADRVDDILRWLYPAP